MESHHHCLEGRTWGNSGFPETRRDQLGSPCHNLTVLQLRAAAGLTQLLPPASRFWKYPWFKEGQGRPPLISALTKAHWGGIMSMTPTSLCPREKLEEDPWRGVS